MELSVIIPSYNEEKTLLEIIKRVKDAEPHDKEIIIVDDFSTDGSREMLKSIKDDSIKVIYHDKNYGKGGAIRNGFAAARGDILVIQDADLEYDPKEIKTLIQPIKDGVADCVYGSRFASSKPQRVHMFTHKIGNVFMTFLTNVLYNSTLSDMTTCYKSFKRDFVKDIKIKSNGFDIEAELTAKILKKKARLYEIPISYYGRRYDEGKQIRFYHAFEIILALLRYRFFD